MNRNNNKNKNENKNTLEELLPLLSERVNKYTSGDSSSVSYDTARQILGSILYCIKVQEEESIVGEMDEKVEKFLIIGERDVRETFLHGLACKKKKVQQGRNLLQNAKDSLLPIENLAYQDTIGHGLDLFFENYDVEYGAQLNPGSIDYPLYQEIEGLSGIDYLVEYLRRFDMEQQFLSKLSLQAITETLLGYHNDWKELLVNLCRITLGNALGCVLIGKDPHHLRITDTDRDILYEILEEHAVEDISELLRHTLQQMLTILELVDEALYKYLLVPIKVLAQEWKQACQLGHLELVFPERKVEEIRRAPDFIEGKSMEDEALREIIEEIQDCRYLSDKLAMLKEGVHSLADLKEILSECFYEDEVKKVFVLLTNAEITMLKQEVISKEEIGELIQDWEQALLEFKK